MIQFEDHPTGRREAYIVGPATTEDAEVYRDSCDTHDLVLNGARGWDASLQSVVEAFANCAVTRLTLFGPAGLDIEAIGSFSQLTELNISGQVCGNLDLDWFPRLSVFGFGAELKGAHRVNLTWGRCAELQSLGMSGSKLPPISSLALFPRISKLTISKPAFEAAELGSIRGLTSLAASFWPKLNSFEEFGILIPKLESLRIYSATKILDYTAVAGMHRLRALMLEKCPPLPSVTLLSKLESLEILHLIEMKVLDGDLSPLLRMPTLRDLAMGRHVHYKPSVLEVEAFLNARNAARP